MLAWSGFGAGVFLLMLVLPLIWRESETLALYGGLFIGHQFVQHLSVKCCPSQRCV